MAREYMPQLIAIAKEAKEFSDLEINNFGDYMNYQLLFSELTIELEGGVIEEKSP